MKKLASLLNLVECTRSMPQTGYALLGIPASELSNLAEHHYLVSFIGWQIATHLKNSGAKIDVQKVMELCMIHDLGELLGGDIAMPYAKANPKAREYAKLFESENLKYLGNYFGDKKHFKDLANEVLDGKSDESIVAKIADYMEVIHYRRYAKAIKENDHLSMKEKLILMVEGIEDIVSRKALLKILDEWSDDFSKTKESNDI